MRTRTGGEPFRHRTDAARRIAELRADRAYADGYVNADLKIPTLADLKFPRSRVLSGRNVYGLRFIRAVNVHRLLLNCTF